MKCPSTNTSLRAVNSDCERGVVFPLMVFAIIAIFAMMGLAIDGGRMYSASLASQNWADSAAFSAASQIVLNSNDYDNLSTTVLNRAKDAARQVATQSARFSSFERRNFSVNVSAAKSGGTIVTNSLVQFDLPLYLMRVVPGFGSKITIRNAARAEVTPTLGMITLDASGSMNCPHSGDCSCYPNCGPDSNLRLAELIKVVKDEILDRFDRTRDMIGVMVYDKTVKPLVAINPAGGFTQLTTAEEDIYKLNAKTFQPSNITLALIRAYEAVNVHYANPLLRNRTPFIGLLSDGAPTATCWHLSDIKGAVSAQFDPPPPPPGTPAGPPMHIGCTWEVTWEGFFDPGDPNNFIVTGDSLSGIRDDRLLQKEGIAPLSTASSYSAVPVIHHAVDKGFDKPACSNLTFQGWAGPTLAGDPEDAINELGTCLNSFKTIDLDGNAFPPTAAQAPINKPDPGAGMKLSGIDEWRKHFYHTAIAQADAIRGRGYTLYTFGLGQAAGTALDEYDNLDDTLGMKSSQLQRIALQYNQPAYIGTHLSQEDPPRYDYPIPHIWENLINNDSHNKGEFFPVDFDQPDTMRKRMREFVRRVKVRMVN